ncbi:capsid [uncultured virus]|uniref:Capsid n=1 Tax=uncultured virus TaxID=340016 RepID=A0A2K9LRY2_9VIRU|nr:capsid [uncultured virus]
MALAAVAAGTGAVVADRILDGIYNLASAHVNNLSQRVRDELIRPANSANGPRVYVPPAKRRRLHSPVRQMRRYVRPRYRRRRTFRRRYTRSRRSYRRRGFGRQFKKLRNVVRRTKFRRANILSNTYKIVKDKIGLGHHSLLVWPGSGASYVSSSGSAVTAGVATVPWQITHLSGAGASNYQSKYDEFRTASIDIVIEPNYGEQATVNMAAIEGSYAPLMGAIVPVTGEEDSSFTALTSWAEIESLPEAKFFPLLPTSKEKKHFSFKIRPTFHRIDTYKDANYNSGNSFTISRLCGQPWQDIPASNTLAAQFVIYTPFMQTGYNPTLNYCLNVSATLTTLFRGVKGEEQ